MDKERVEPLCYGSEQDASQAVTKELIAAVAKYPSLAQLAADYCGVQLRAVNDWLKGLCRPQGANLICLLGLMQSLHLVQKLHNVALGLDASNLASVYQYKLLMLLHKKVMTEEAVNASFKLTMRTVRLHAYTKLEVEELDIVGPYNKNYGQINSLIGMVWDWCRGLELSYPSEQVVTGAKVDKISPPKSIGQTPINMQTIACALEIIAIHLPEFLAESAAEDRESLRNSVGSRKYFEIVTGLGRLSSETAFRESQQPVVVNRKGNRNGN